MAAADRIPWIQTQQGQYFFCSDDRVPGQPGSFRAGEVLKCTVLARYEKVPADKLVGTIILERLVDAISLSDCICHNHHDTAELYEQLVDKIFNSPETDEGKKIPGYVVLLIVLGHCVVNYRTVDDNQEEKL